MREIGSRVGAILVAGAPARLAEVHRCRRQLQQPIACDHSLDRALQMKQRRFVVVECKQGQPTPHVGRFTDEPILGGRLAVLEAVEHG